MKRGGNGRKGAPIMDFGDVAEALNKVCEGAQFGLWRMTERLTNSITTTVCRLTPTCLSACRFVMCLVRMAAQLDAGVPEKILLMSRDEQSMLVASYADLKVSFVGAGRGGRGTWGQERANGGTEGNMGAGRGTKGNMGAGRGRTDGDMGAGRGTVSVPMPC